MLFQCPTTSNNRNADPFICCAAGASMDPLTLFFSRRLKGEVALRTNQLIIHNLSRGEEAFSADPGELACSVAAGKGKEGIFGLFVHVCDRLGRMTVS